MSQSHEIKSFVMILKTIIVRKRKQLRVARIDLHGFQHLAVDAVRRSASFGGTAEFTIDR